MARLEKSNLYHQNFQREKDNIPYLSNCLLEQGPAATGKAATSGQGSQKKTVPERLRRESSTTTLKAVKKIGGLSYPHKGKGATRPRY